MRTNGNVLLYNKGLGFQNELFMQVIRRVYMNQENNLLVTGVQTIVI